MRDWTRLSSSLSKRVVALAVVVAMLLYRLVIWADCCNPQVQLTLSKHPINSNTPYQYIPSIHLSIHTLPSHPINHFINTATITHPINPSYQHIYQYTPYQPTLSTHLSIHTLSTHLTNTATNTHPINTPYQHNLQYILTFPLSCPLPSPVLSPTPPSFFPQPCPLSFPLSYPLSCPLSFSSTRRLKRSHSPQRQIPQCPHLSGETAQVTTTTPATTPTTSYGCQTDVIGCTY